MKELRSKLVEGAGKLCSTGFFSIFMSCVVMKIIGFLGGMLLVRLLSKSDYGAYSYVLNAYGILTLLADCGTGITSVQMCSEVYGNPIRQSAIFSFALRNAMLVSLFSCLLLFFSGLFYPYSSPNLLLLTSSLFLLPVITNLNRFILNNAQIKLQNNTYAIINLFSSLMRYLILLPAAYFFSLKGAVYSDYLIQSAVLFFGVYRSKDFLCFRASEKKLPREERFSFFKLSFSSALNNIINNSLTYCDVFLLGLILSSMEIIASYKVAAIIPTALMFIPSAVHVYVMPYFARHKDDIKWVKTRYFQVAGLMFAFNLIVCTGGTLTGSYILEILYGTGYRDASACFNVLLLGYFFSSLRFITYIVIYTQRKVSVNIVITIVANVLNIILDVTLIPRFASLGAAWASTAVNVTVALIMFVYLLWHLHRRANV